MVNRERYTPLSEQKIESAVVEYAAAEGVTVYKFTSPNVRGVPDRLFLYRGHAMFIEFKAENNNQGFDKLQQLHRDVLAEQDVPVFPVNGVDQGKGIVDGFIGACDSKLNYWRQ